MSKRTGFTIIELLTVIAMIGLLIAIVQPMLTSSASRTYEYQCESHLRQIGVAMHAYSQDYGVFPSGLGQIDGVLQDKNLLECPKTSHAYYYRQPPADADRDLAVASCVDPHTRKGQLPHRFGIEYLTLTAGGNVRRVTR